MASYVPYVSFLSLITIPRVHTAQAYFRAASDLHMTQIKAFLSVCSTMIKKGAEDDTEGKRHVMSRLYALIVHSSLRRCDTIWDHG